MRENAEFCAAQFCGIDNRGVNQFVDDDDVVFVGERANRSERGGVTGGKNQRGFGLFELSERLLEFVVRRERAANQPLRAGACAEFFNRLHRGFFEQRVIGQAEIIVGRKIQERFAADLNARRLRRIDAAQLAQKILFAKRVEPLLEFDVKFRRQPATKFSVTENESNEEVS